MDGSHSQVLKTFNTIIWKEKMSIREAEQDIFLLVCVATLS